MVVVLAPIFHFLAMLEASQQTGDFSGKASRSM